MIPFRFPDLSGCTGSIVCIGATWETSFVFQLKFTFVKKKNQNVVKSSGVNPDDHTPNSKKFSTKRLQEVQAFCASVVATRYSVNTTSDMLHF